MRSRRPGLASRKIPEAAGRKRRNTCRRAHTLTGLESTAWLNVLLAAACSAALLMRAKARAAQATPNKCWETLCPALTFQKIGSSAIFGTSALLRCAVFGGGRYYRARSVCGYYRVPKDGMFPRSGLTHFLSGCFGRLLSATGATWQPPQMKFMKCIFLCMAENVRSVSQATLWKCFKGDFQMQKEKECLDKK